MASINDLNKITAKPRTLWEWLDRFSDEDRETVIGKMLIGATSELYPVLSELDHNPYPFERGTINYHRAKLREAMA